jgi:hypothetical protein
MCRLRFLTGSSDYLDRKNNNNIDHFNVYRHYYRRFCEASQQNEKRIGETIAILGTVVLGKMTRRSRASISSCVIIVLKCEGDSCSHPPMVVMDEVEVYLEEAYVFTKFPQLT